MASKCYCDFCGKELGEKWDYTKDFVDFRIVAGNGLVMNYYADVHLHLCNTCARKLFDYIKSFAEEKSKAINKEDWIWNEGGE